MSKHKSGSYTVAGYELVIEPEGVTIIDNETGNEYDNFMPVKISVTLHNGDSVDFQDVVESYLAYRQENGCCGACIDADDCNLKAGLTC